MFKVRHKGTGTIYTVYDVTGVRFMIWVDDPSGEGYWSWLDITDCEPFNEYQ